MRESNFAFPAQNRACVCISSQLYDRRALDTTSPLPLFNSLHHLTYLTSSSPRIREIMTMDGGLERLVRILHDFCICPPPPENPNFIYGLSPPNSRSQKLVPTLNPPNFDKHAAYRFSLAFQCVVNIGVRGSEPIRSRVVQAGTLDVVGCILEAWLANKGFAVSPSSSASGIPRQTREQRLARRQALAEQRQREGVPVASELTRALQRQIVSEESTRQARGAATADTSTDEDVSMTAVHNDRASETLAMSDSSHGLSVPGASTDRLWHTHHSLARRTAREASSTTPATTGGNPQAGTRMVGARGRSGTIVVRTVWDESIGANATLRPRQNRSRTTTSISPDESTDNSRPETETEDDGDVDMDQSHDTTSIPPPIPRPPRVPTRSITQRPRRTVGIISEAPVAPPMEVNADAHIIINHDQGGVVNGDGVSVVGVEEGIVSLEPNDDFAMGAPPGAPGAMDETRNLREADAPVLERRVRTAPDVTPRAVAVPLPQPTGTPSQAVHGTARLGAAAPPRPDRTLNVPPTAIGRTSSHSHHHRDTDSGPYKDEDVLLGLQLLAYLSKYPHVRQAFYKPRVSFHPATAAMSSARAAQHPLAGSTAVHGQSSKDGHGFFRAFVSASARGKEKEKTPLASGAPAPRMTNVFSLVERFTFRPSSSENDLPNPPPRLPPEIQYWAGVIMRNACRKDDSRGGIRQCANMLCGRWESYPREFAKCRRCRKAKYCGKECQSTAWSEGHRFWCSAKEGEDAEDPATVDSSQSRSTGGENGVTEAPMAHVWSERRAARGRETLANAHPPGPVQSPSVPPASLATRPRVSALPVMTSPPSSSNITATTTTTTVNATGAGVNTNGNTNGNQNMNVNQNMYVQMQMQRRRRAETVSGATTVVGMTPNGRPVHRHEVPWLADGRAREVDEGGPTGGVTHRHARMDSMIWESPPQGDNDMVLG